jgi:hypothetical protein
VYAGIDRTSNARGCADHYVADIKLACDIVQPYLTSDSVTVA